MKTVKQLLLTIFLLSFFVGLISLYFVAPKIEALLILSLVGFLIIFSIWKIAGAILDDWS